MTISRRNDLNILKYQVNCHYNTIKVLIIEGGEAFRLIISTYAVQTGPRGDCSVAAIYAKSCAQWLASQWSPAHTFLTLIDT